MRSFDPLIQIRRMVQCESYKLSSDHWFINVVGDVNFLFHNDFKLQTIVNMNTNWKGIF